MHATLALAHNRRPHTHTPLGLAQGGGGVGTSQGAATTLERCLVTRCEALSSDWAVAAAEVHVLGGGVYNSGGGAYVVMRGTLLSDCRAEIADGDGLAVRVPCGLALGGWRRGGVSGWLLRGRRRHCMNACTQDVSARSRDRH